MKLYSIPIASLFCIASFSTLGTEEKCLQAEWTNDRVTIRASLEKKEFSSSDALNFKLVFENLSDEKITITHWGIEKDFSYELYDAADGKAVQRRNADVVVMGDIGGSRTWTTIPRACKFEYKGDLKELYDLQPGKEYRLNISGFYSTGNVKQPFTIKDLPLHCLPLSEWNTRVQWQDDFFAGASLRKGEFPPSGPINLKVTVQNTGTEAVIIYLNGNPFKELEFEILNAEEKVPAKLTEKGEAIHRETVISGILQRIEPGKSHQWNIDLAQYFAFEAGKEYSINVRGGYMNRKNTDNSFTLKNLRFALKQ